MAYNINRTDETTLVTLSDGTTDTSYSSLTLIGKNFAGYGEFLNENFVKLLENFSRNTSPPNPLEGQLWWNSSTNILNVYDGSVWKSASGMISSATEPTSPMVGDTWWDTTVNQTKSWDGAEWVLVGPVYSLGQGLSGFKIETITDTLDVAHVVAKVYVSTVLVAIISKDTTFDTVLSGFTTIMPGINMSTVVSPTFLINGTATNSLSLGGVLASGFAKLADAPSFTQKATFLTDDGISIGSPANVDINIVSGDLYIKNKAANKNIILSVMKGAVQTPVLTIDGTTGLALVNAAPSADFGVVNKKYVDDIVTGVASPALARAGGNTITGVILPDGNGTRDFGSGSFKYATIYANTFNGSFTGSGANLTSVPNGALSNSSVTIGTTTISLGATSLTLGGLTSVTATNFIGTSSSAKYADIAERFAADREYAPGTVVELGGTEEITAVGEELSNKVFGVISSQAAYLMNSEAGPNATHPPIAMQGRVPVNVIGTVKKGDRLVSAGNGLARAAAYGEFTSFNVIGRALENKTTSGEGTIEAVVRLNS